MKKIKIGLLLCDHVRDEFRHIAGDYSQMFPTLFDQVSPHWEWAFYDVVNNHFPENIHECDAYISTGSKYSVYDDEPWIVRLKDFVKQLYQSNKLYIGVCFGHQMLGEALGGVVQKAVVGWCVGVHTFELKATAIPPKLKEAFKHVPNHFSLLMMCQDQVLKLPPDTVVLASTPDCPNAMILVGNHILGIQAHPEFTVAYEEALMQSRVERIGNEKVNVAMRSLNTPTHSIEIAQFIVRFVEAVL